MRLAQQYPQNKLSLFQSFTGVIYKLQVWQRFIKLPVHEGQSDAAEGRIVDISFLGEDQLSDGSGWSQSNGFKIPARDGQDFNFVSERVPLNIDFDNPATYGQLDATETQWNGVSC